MIERVAHASGRFTASRKQIEVALDDLRVRHVSIIGRTETGSAPHRAAMQAWCRTHGWKMTSHEGLSVLWDASVFEREGILRDRFLTLTKRFWKRGNGNGVDGLHAAGIRLRHRDTKRVWHVRVMHLPSDIQAGDDWKGGPDSPRAKVAREVIASIGASTARLKRRHPKWVLLVMGDVNADLRREAWEDRLSDGFGLDHLAKGFRDLRGTHAGNRWIDSIWGFGVEPDGTATTRPSAGHDHWSVLVDIRHWGG
jgi:hypothetical protein